MIDTPEEKIQPLWSQVPFLLKATHWDFAVAFDSRSCSLFVRVRVVLTVRVRVVKRGFIKGEAIRLLRTNSSEINFHEAISSFKTRLQTRDYPKQLVDKTVSEVTFAGRQSALHKQNRKTDEKIIPLFITFHPGVKKA